VDSYIRSWWGRDEADGACRLFQVHFTLPEYRQGIPAAMLAWLEQRQREIFAELVAAGVFTAGAEHSSDAFVEVGETGRLEVLVGRGYTEVRRGYHMIRPLSEPVIETPLPAGLEVRPAIIEHLRQIWDANQEAFRDHWGYIQSGEQDFQAWLEDPELDLSYYQVAWEGDQVAGMVLAFINPHENEEYRRKRGYTEGIAVRRPWRRQGLARALLTRAMRVLKEAGMEEAALGVDTQNLSGALRLYESVGFRVQRYSLFLRKPL
jgi:ribosomal protein S18 acetylase RimI-like enzyme